MVEKKNEDIFQAFSKKGWYNRKNGGRPGRGGLCKAASAWAGKGGNHLKKEVRIFVYDEELQIEASWFRGMVRPFPNHFHEYYVLGLIEKGQRALSCKNSEYRLAKGDMVLFNPGDNHGCAHLGDEALDYRGLHISKEVMLPWAREVTGREGLPGFSQNVVRDEEAARELRALHAGVMEEGGRFAKEEHFLLLLSRLLQTYGQPFAQCTPECRAEIEKACAFIHGHLEDRICLEDICREVGLSKSTLLRAFTKEKGVTPYRYLETARVNKAKELLEQGISPAEAAQRMGFADQSHFTNYFDSFIGLGPGAYREIFAEKKQEERVI